MPRDYIYFVSSLPLLAFDGEPPFSFEEFLRDCAVHLSSDEFIIAGRIFDNDIEDLHVDDETLQALIGFNRQFQNELAFFRAERAHKDPADYLRGTRLGNSFYTEVIHQTAKHTDLFEAEKLIDRLKWGVWEDITATSHFSLGNIVVFGLKLKMQEKYQQALRSSKGGEVFREISDPEFLEQYLYRVNK
jgi:hypothetical protein